MSLLDSIKKGLFDQEDDYEDQYIDDGPQMVNNNNGIGLGADDENEEPVEGAKKNGKVVNINATTQLKVVLVKPERFEDASTIADHLNNSAPWCSIWSPPTRKCPAVWWTSCPVLHMQTMVRSSAWPTAPSSSLRTTWISWVICWTSWRTMARSIDPQPKAARGFIPARTDEERYLMRHIEDLAHTAFSRDIARYSAFLSDREQDLARAALGRAGVQEGFRFEGGWLNAERRVLCIEPEYSCGEAPICCVRLQCRAQAGDALPAHKDYLGSLMGLELRREALGDIVLPEDQPGTAYVFALEPAAQLICRELFQAGHTELTTELLTLDEVPQFPQAEREMHSATVSSLRLDAVLAAMLHCSRGQASELIEAGRVEINHLPADKPHAQVYEGDVFTVRGKGRFNLTALPGKSRKDRSIIEFFQY